MHRPASLAEYKTHCTLLLQGLGLCLHTLIHFSCKFPLQTQDTHDILFDIDFHSWHLVLHLVKHKRDLASVVLIYSLIGICFRGIHCFKALIQYSSQLSTLISRTLAFRIQYNSYNSINSYVVVVGLCSSKVCSSVVRFFSPTVSFSLTSPLVLHCWTLKFIFAHPQFSIV